MRRDLVLLIVSTSSRWSWRVWSTIKIKPSGISQRKRLDLWLTRTSWDAKTWKGW